MACTMPDLLYDCHSVMLFKLGFPLGYMSDDGEKNDVIICVQKNDAIPLEYVGDGDEYDQM